MKKHYTVREYYQHFSFRMHLLVIFAITLSGGMAAGAAYGLGIPTTSYTFYLTIAISMVVCAINLIWIYIVAVKPLKILHAAIAHTSNEPSSITPPNPNSAYAERTHLTPVLKFIYKQQTTLDQSTTEKTDSSENTPLAKMLMDSKVGILSANEQYGLLYANTACPVKPEASTIDDLNLAIHDVRTLHAWFDESAEKINNFSSWRRVPSMPDKEGNYNVYDIYAHYEQGSLSPYTLIFADTTADYAAEDDQLDFISFAAHELRSPITVIRGYLDVVMQETTCGGSFTDEHRELLSKIAISSNRLSTTVNNILSAARYDGRHMKLNLKKQSFFSLYSSINDDLSMRVNSQRRILDVQIPDGLPDIAANRQAVSEVIINLVENAVKYSSEGGHITVKAEQEKTMLRVSVIDEGIGIPPNILRNLFRKFYRSHRSKDTVAGSGIGLYICKMITESHGGTISASSKEGKGSTFSFTLPLYDTVAEQLHQTNNSNEAIITQESQTIHNHELYNA